MPTLDTNTTEETNESQPALTTDAIDILGSLTSLRLASLSHLDKTKLKDKEIGLDLESNRLFQFLNGEFETYAFTGEIKELATEMRKRFDALESYSQLSDLIMAVKVTETTLPAIPDSASSVIYKVVADPDSETTIGSIAIDGEEPQEIEVGDALYLTSTSDTFVHLNQGGAKIQWATDEEFLQGVEGVVPTAMQVLSFVAKTCDEFLTKAKAYTDEKISELRGFTVEQTEKNAQLVEELDNYVKSLKNLEGVVRVEANSTSPYIEIINDNQAEIIAPTGYIIGQITPVKPALPALGRPSADKAVYSNSWDTITEKPIDFRVLFTPVSGISQLIS